MWQFYDTFTSMNTVTAEWIFPVTTPPVHGHSIEIHNGIIQKIRPALSDEECIPGSCIIPGLINAHTHLAYTALRNLFDDLSFFPWIRKLTEVKYEKLTEEDIAASTRLGIAECIRGGITTVADLCDFEIALQELSRSPLRGIFYWEVFGVEKQQADETWKSIQENFPKLVSKHSSSRLQIGISPHACFTVRPELYQQIAKWAVDNHVPVSFHAAESREEEVFIGQRSGPIQEFLQKRAADWKILGNTSITHLRETGIFETQPLLAHLVQASDADLDVIKKYGISVVHCPKSNAKFAHGIAPVSSMLHRGIQVCVGTDSAASNNRLDLFEEARFAFLQQRSQQRKPVLTEQQVLEMMTIRGAESLKMEKLIGSLESDKRADLVILKIPPYYSNADQVLRHIIHNVTSEDVVQTFIDGKAAVLNVDDSAVAKIYTKLSE
jgi:cytosine/adenosine deaminase-related metal-dependent hydrolase